MKSLLSILISTLLGFIPLNAQAEPSILKPGSILCKSYQDLIMAKEMVVDDPQFASNALHRTGRCVLGSAYQEQPINVIDKKNAGYQIQFLNNVNKYWILHESIKSTNIVRDEKIVVYPASGQSINELLADKSECNAFAVQQTGYQPGYHSSDTSSRLIPPPINSFESEGRGSNAARGAAAGAIGGSIAGDVGSGAGIGVLAGALFGGVERSQRAAEEAEWQRQYQSMQNYHLQDKNNQNLILKKQYYFSYKSCLQKRGYEVR